MPKRPPDPPEFTASPRLPAKVKTKAKPKRKERDPHDDFVASLPCCICGNPFSEVHHLLRVPRPFKQHGMGQKTELSVPLCDRHHRGAFGVHQDGDEKRFFAYHQLNPVVLALALWGVTGEDEKAIAILEIP